MKAMMDYVKVRYLSRFLGEKGQGIVEYALILGFVVVVALVLTGQGGIQERITGVFDSIRDALPASGGGTTGGTT